MAIFHVAAAAIALLSPIRTSARVAPGSTAEARISDTAVGFTLREDLGLMSLEDTVSQCAPPPPLATSDSLHACMRAGRCKGCVVGHAAVFQLHSCRVIM